MLNSSRQYVRPVSASLRSFVGAANPDYDESASIPTNSYRPSRGVSKVQAASAIRFALVTEAKPHGPPSWEVDICPTVRPRNPQSGQLFAQDRTPSVLPAHSVAPLARPLLVEGRFL